MATFKNKTLYISDINPSIIKKDFVQPEEMDYWELSNLILKFEKNGIDATRWLVNKHYKTAFACVPLIMVIFGVALSIQKPRGNRAFKRFWRFALSTTLLGWKAFKWTKP